MELLKRRHLTVQKYMGLLNSGTLNRGEVLCDTVAVDHRREKLVDEFHEILMLSVMGEHQTKGTSTNHFVNECEHSPTVLVLHLQCAPPTLSFYEG